MVFSFSDLVFPCVARCGPGLFAPFSFLIYGDSGRPGGSLPVFLRSVLAAPGHVLRGLCPLRATGRSGTTISKYPEYPMDLRYTNRGVCASPGIGALKLLLFGALLFRVRLLPAHIGFLVVAENSIAVNPLTKDAFRRGAPAFRFTWPKIGHVYRTVVPNIPMRPWAFYLTNRAKSYLDSLYILRNYRFLQYSAGHRVRFKKWQIGRSKYKTRLPKQHAPLQKDNNFSTSLYLFYKPFPSPTRLSAF